MDTFILAATSFTISVSLMITGKKDRLQTAFAGLCAAVCVSQAAISLNNYFHFSLLLKISYIGSLAIAPSALWFSRCLTGKQSLISRKIFLSFTLAGLCGTFFIFTPLSGSPFFNAVLLYYTLVAVGVCFIALMRHVKKLPMGDEKKRLGYLLFACPLAVILIHIDLLNYWGLSLPVVNGIISSALLYFILLVVAYPQLRELHDFFARSLVIFISTIAGAVIVFFASLSFGGTPPSLAGLLLASFLIVISLSPTKMILRKMFSYFYPDSRDVFTSLYEFDEKLEREKAVMLAEMAPVFAHEIRNPLGSIKGAAQYLRTEAVTEEQQALLNVIIEGTDRLNNVVGKFLDYARPYTLNLKAQSINRIIQKAVSIIAANKLAENIAIIQKLDEDSPDARVDEQQFMQVIINLALNAIEAMPQGGDLTFSTSGGKADAEGAITVTVSDTGTGISNNNFKDIFKPFFTTKERGVGLGLAICQKIIKEHGGAISAKSNHPQGTVFLIRLKTAP